MAVTLINVFSVPKGKEPDASLFGSQIMAACKRDSMTRILIDCHESSTHSTVADVWTLAGDLGSLGVSQENRIAVLNRPKDGFDRAAFLELCAGNRGYRMRAFREFEGAITWLVSEQLLDKAIAECRPDPGHRPTAIFEPNSDTA